MMTNLKKSRLCSVQNTNHGLALCALNLVEQRVKFCRSLLPVIKLRLWTDIVRLFPHLLALCQDLKVREERFTLISRASMSRKRMPCYKFRNQGQRCRPKKKAASSYTQLSTNRMLSADPPTSPPPPPAQLPLSVSGKKCSHHLPSRGQSNPTSLSSLKLFSPRHHKIVHPLILQAIKSLGE